MTKRNAQDTFRAKAPGIMGLLLRDFPMLGVEDAAAILGNLGHESNGFTELQERAPTVKGSRGGYGWAQWTGPRRTDFEAYCKRNNLDPASDKANYGWLFCELKGPERRAIPALINAATLAGKVMAFELAFERAGKKHYESRNQWAKIALDAYWADYPPKLPDWAMPGPEPVPVPIPTPKPEAEPEERIVIADPEDLAKPARKSKTFWTWLLTAIGTPIAAFGGLDWRAQLAIVVVIVGFAIYGIKRRADLAKVMRELKEEFE